MNNRNNPNVAPARVESSDLKAFQATIKQEWDTYQLQLKQLIAQTQNTTLAGSPEF